MKQRVFILGAGRFGTNLGSRLSELGFDVVLADRNPRRVKDLAESGFHALEMAADDETALKTAGVQRADLVVVSIGENMQGSILATLLLKELGVKKLIVRAMDGKHEQVLEKLGADLVVLPSRDMANMLAERLRSQELTERLPISGEYQLAHIPLNETLEGQSLLEAKLPQTFNVTVVLIRRGKAEEDPKEIEPAADFILRPGDLVSVVGRRANIDRFEADCGSTNEKTATS